MPRGKLAKASKSKENRSNINLAGWSIDEWSWIMGSTLNFKIEQCSFCLECIGTS